VLLIQISLRRLPPGSTSPQSMNVRLWVHASSPYTAIPNVFTFPELGIFLRAGSKLVAKAVIIMAVRAMVNITAKFVFGASICLASRGEKAILSLNKRFCPH